ncbi:HMG-Y-related protein A [Rhynchospora pubera]|uniref:HMG-Y-related protein A n=2 Tax=Rhynchospora pubera TaxID=906938 RepID=A0AAV8HBP0_9POAL|nr:HMG-Y-related protein A [Rhynchospora pubera]
MATETEEAPRSALPPYPEMILTALKTLNDKNGSNKSAISKFIESKHGELPESHSSLLTAHLARMKEGGELIFLKNNYFIAGPGSPPKRGRGRPPKPKDGSAPDPKPPSSPKPRGRPPKAKDVVAEAVAKATSGMPKSRGRPPKKARDEGGDADAGAAPAKKGRGRPPKVKASEGTEEQ